MSDQMDNENTAKSEEVKIINPDINDQAEELVLPLSPSSSFTDFELKNFSSFSSQIIIFKIKKVLI